MMVLLRIIQYQIFQLRVLFMFSNSEYGGISGIIERNFKNLPSVIKM